MQGEDVELLRRKAGKSAVLQAVGADWHRNSSGSETVRDAQREQIFSDHATTLMAAHVEGEVSKEELLAFFQDIMRIDYTEAYDSSVVRVDASLLVAAALEIDMSELKVDAENVQIIAYDNIPLSVGEFFEDYQKGTIGDERFFQSLRNITGVDYSGIYYDANPDATAQVKNLGAVAGNLNSQSKQI